MFSIPDQKYVYDAKLSCYFRHENEVLNSRVDVIAQSPNASQEKHLNLSSVVRWATRASLAGRDGRGRIGWSRTPLLRVPPSCNWVKLVEAGIHSTVDPRTPILRDVLERWTGRQSSEDSSTQRWAIRVLLTTP